MNPDRHSSALADSAMATADSMFARRKCCCFWIPWSTDGHTRKATWERIQREEEERGGWWRRALMKVKEWSEIVAGPRWKTFIRQFRRNAAKNGGGRRRRHGKKFHYDPLSYALNFDEGNGHGGDSDGDAAFRGFSARYATPPASAKSSMDLGGRDAPPLFAATSAAAI